MMHISHSFFLWVQAPFGAVGIGTWAAQYSRRGLRLRRRGAYSPVLMHGLRVVSPQGKRLTMICASLALLQIMFAVHRFAQGAADWRSGPRWRIISALCPVHPFPLRGTSPQGETRDMREKTERHILQVPFRRFPPLVAGATTFPPQAGALWMLSHGAMSLQESIEIYSAP